MFFNLALSISERLQNFLSLFGRCEVLLVCDPLGGAKLQSEPELFPSTSESESIWILGTVLAFCFFKTTSAGSEVDFFALEKIGESGSDVDLLSRLNGETGSEVDLE